MNKAFYLIYIFLVLCFLGCTESRNNRGEAYNYLGDNAAMVLKVTDVRQLKTDLKANSLLEATTDPIFNFISTSEILSNWDSQSPFYFSTSGEGQSAAIVFTKALDTLSTAIDSIPNISVEKSTVNEQLYKKLLFKEDSLFAATKDSVAIFSTNKNALETIVELEENKLNKANKRLLKISQEADISKITNTKLYPERLSTTANLLASKSLHILPDGIQVSGIIKSKDSSLIDIFKGQVPQKSNIAAMLPSDFKSVDGFTFTDVQLLVSNLKRQKQDTTQTIVHPLLKTVSEIAEAQLKNGKALIMSSIDMDQSYATIELDLLKIENHRDNTIYENNLYTLIASTFTPLVSSQEYPYLVLLDNYIVCTNNLATAKTIIEAYINKNVLAKTEYYGSIKTQMLSTCSLYTLGQDTAVSSITNATLDISAPEKSRKKYPIAVLQYSYDNTFAHLNFVSKEMNAVSQVSGTVRQKFSKNLEQNILGKPQFFTNHRTKGKDVLVQDITGSLHLYSINGKKLWSKKLDNPILGKIQEVDLLRNGKKQLAFATKNMFYILDRNGKAVAPFPLKFKDNITQPLALFDYDNNRKYRFVITQDNAVFMYDSKGKSVKGFTFKKTKTPLVFPPEHIRLGNKDFIVLAEEKGKATFLSRAGKERIKVKENFNFGAIKIQKEGSQFVIISEDKKKHTISTSGKVSSKNISVSESYSFKTLGKNKVTLDDNLLRINKVLVELPFGIYSNPDLVYHKKNLYVAVTDLQEHKVCVYGSNRKLLKGFPVFGKTAPTLVSNGKNLFLTTTGSDKEVLCYQVR